MSPPSRSTAVRPLIPHHSLVIPNAEEESFVYHVQNYQCPDPKSKALVTLTYKNKELFYQNPDIKCVPTESALVSPMTLLDEELCHTSTSNEHAYEYITSISPSTSKLEEFMYGLKPLCCILFFPPLHTLVPTCNSSTEGKTYNYDTGLTTNQDGQQIVTVTCKNGNYVANPLPDTSCIPLLVYPMLLDNSIAVISAKPTPSDVTVTIHKRGTKGTLYCGYRPTGKWPSYITCNDIKNPTTTSFTINNADQSEYTKTLTITKNSYNDFYCCGEFEGKGFTNRLTDTFVYVFGGISFSPSRNGCRLSCLSCYRHRWCQPPSHSWQHNHFWYFEFSSIHH